MRVPNIGRSLARPKPPDDGVDLRINDETTPVVPGVRTVDQDSVCEIYYPLGNQKHGHHLQSADPDLAMATWSWNEQGRQLQQEDRNEDDTIK